MGEIKKESRSFKRLLKYDNWTNSHLNTTMGSVVLSCFECHTQRETANENERKWTKDDGGKEKCHAISVLFGIAYAMRVRHMFSHLLYLYRICSGHIRVQRLTNSIFRNYLFASRIVPHHIFTAHIEAHINSYPHHSAHIHNANVYKHWK